MATFFAQMERHIALRSAAFVVAGQADEKFVRWLARHARVLRVGNGTDHIDQPPVRPADDGRTIGFHGNMTWPPNQLTARRLATRFAKRLNRGIEPKFWIDIAGGPICSDLEIRDGENGVRIRGFVKDLRMWFASLSLYVMPMYGGAGIKNKLIEAMAMGVPVLTNELGAEGLEPEARDAVAVVKNDKQLIRAIRVLLNNPERLSAMRQAGRSHAEKHYRWETHRERLHAELRRLKTAGQL